MHVLVQDLHALKGEMGEIEVLAGWCWSSPLKEEFPLIFQINQSQEAEVAKTREDSGWNIRLRRNCYNWETDTC